jgi:hypothetical protein
MEKFQAKWSKHHLLFHDITYETLVFMILLNILQLKITVLNKDTNATCDADISHN